MRFGDVVFEGGDDKFSGAIKRAQRFLPGKDHEITHALIVVGSGLALEADPKHGVHFRQFTGPADLDYVRYVMRSNAVQAGDEEAQRQVCKAGVAAFAAFLGEKYSFGQILLHKLDDRLASEMSATLGATFCSALVKRVLTVAGLADGLSRTLLMSPSELHAELSAAAGWKPVSIEEFGMELRGPTESVRRLARELGLKSDLDVAARFAKANPAFIETFEAATALQDAIGEATLALAGVNLLKNADDPLDLVEEAGMAQWWRELGDLIGRARWTLAKSEPLYRDQREKLAKRLQAALPRVVAATRLQDPARKIFNEFQTLYDASDIEGLEKLAGRIASFCAPALALHYASGRDALIGADDAALKGLGQVMDLRLKSLERITGIAKLTAELLEE